ncbi:MAG: FAD binding domain-containing protein [Anaerolineae bacterium]|nr:FAD binding domain-containing protein [Anaerolineae bacterium]
MKFWTHYYTPHTVDEALVLLRQCAGGGRVIAGGTDLLVDARAEGEPAAEALIDVTAIPELRQISESDGQIVIGAGVTHAQIVKSDLLQRKAACLVESCGVVGGPQVRNVGTLGGNVAHALPAGDGTVSLVALDAEAEIILNGERRWLPIADLYLGPGKSLLDSTRDLLLRFRFRASSAGEATAFSRIMRPQGVALPILGCAVWLRLDAARANIEAARIYVAPISPKPTRAVEVEAMLAGQPAVDETVQRAAEFAVTALHPRTSKYRATAEYRQEMIAVLLQRTLTAAIQRARG